MSDVIANAASPMTLAVTSDVGAVANFLDECVKAGLAIEELFNSPQMQSARINAAKQKIEDQDALDAQQALASGNLAKVNIDQSP
jgi:hypothetical protein